MLSPAQYAVANGADLYDWQIEALEAFGQGWTTALITCNGAGKTAVVAAWSVAWFFYAYPQGKLAGTSGSFTQLQNQLWGAIKQHLPSSFNITNGSSPCTIKSKEGGVGVGFSTNDPGKAEGYHPFISKDVDPVMILVDEAKTVPEGVFTAFDRCTYSFVLYISSAGPPMGRFFECFHSLKKYYYTIQVDYTMCPHIEKQKVDRMRDQYGEDSYEFNSIMMAKFTEQGEDFIMTKMQLEDALKFQPKESTNGEKVAFFDFARGGDENTFTIREGNKIRILDCWRDRDTVQAVRKFIRIAKVNGLSSGECWGDADGLGGPMIDVFHDEGFPINEFHGGARALDENYMNLISEAWIQGARRIQRGDFNLGVLDVQTVEQLTNRKFEWNKAGKKKTESKDDMRKRGVTSPDRGDGIMCVMICGSHMSGAITQSTAESAEMGTSEFDSGHHTF